MGCLLLLRILLNIFNIKLCKRVTTVTKIKSMYHSIIDNIDNKLVMDYLWKRYQNQDINELYTCIEIPSYAPEILIKKVIRYMNKKDGFKSYYTKHSEGEEFIAYYIFISVQRPYINSFVNTPRISSKSEEEFNKSVCK